jgi:copper chaperone
MTAGPPVTIHVTVAGMTYEHWVASVAEELVEIRGVDDVDLTLATGDVTITSTAPLDPADVESAVVGAGYALA